MAVPFAIGRVVDIIYRADAGEARDRLVTICLTLGAVFVVGAAANCGRVYLMTVSGQSECARRCHMGRRGWLLFPEPTVGVRLFDWRL